VYRCNVRQGQAPCLPTATTRVALQWLKGSVWQHNKDRVARRNVPIYPIGTPTIQSDRPKGSTVRSLEPPWHPVS
jgi:hypothetical protein